MLKMQSLSIFFIIFNLYLIFDTIVCLQYITTFKKFQAINHLRMTIPDLNEQNEPKTSISEALKQAKPGKSWYKCRPIGIGGMAGENRVSNQAFQSLVDTNDEWITKRTGIRNRHIINKDSSLRNLAITAASDAVKQSNINPADIDLVIVATSSPDDLFGDAASVAMGIGATNAASFDLTAACSGFLYGIVTGSQFLQSGAYKKVLIVGADALSRFLDWKDRSTCILFGDGAGAIILEATDKVEDSGFLGFSLHSDGLGYCNLDLKFVDNYIELPNDEKTIVNKGSYGNLKMNGAEVYKFAVNEVPKVIGEAISNAGLKASDVDHLLLHQANIRIMEHAAQVLGIPMSKVLKNIEEYGNTSAGSIPLALAEAVRDGIVKKGDIIAIAGFGAGLNWGAAVIRW